ncbi:hypothetical protein B0H66DRAFT_388030 [Apodospora peruviana]|uniref:Uncharacterized protein n=1 Tax=Apodospora peruviana TaxID=516989 RepID=A0AAE0HV95_9PEZI|nr:hypothetical protein B0H66DRAFT_388030 [Apodospora peruviana]
MDLPQSILSCLCPGDDDDAPHSQRLTAYQYTAIDEKPALQAPPSSYADKPATIRNNTRDIALDITNILCQAKTFDEAFYAQLDDAVGTESWSEWLAENIFHALEDTLKADSDTWGEVLSDAYNRALELGEELFTDLFEYAKEHPLEVAATVVLSLTAFGVLARLMPWVLRLIGFGMEGPVADSLAALWQARYAGYVPKGSLFSFLQRLGMTWV